ncbi:DUF6398 domain-containing protein [Intestinibacter sp.]|uniref:DUF6398 domain-containing protein n=1 Tax=Intestinibacter sp. TaxID=1965304 RepID=UPI003F143783
MATDKDKIKQITDIVKTHCDECFNEDYYKTTKKLIDKLKKNKDFSMDKGKIEGWVAGLLYIVGEDSGLFNQTNWIESKEYISKTDMAKIAEVSVATMKSRASKIREVLPKNAKFVADITYEEDDYDFCFGFDDDDDEDGYEMDEVLQKMADMLGHTITTKEEEYEIYMDKAFDSYDIDEAMEYMKLALMHAKKKIPDHLFKQLEGELWLELDARPYLLIKAELADLYYLKDDYESSVELYNDILRLNKNDNQGIRYKIFPLLILLDKKDQIENLIKTYENDECASMLYNKALYYYRNKNELNAKSFLKKAFKANEYIPDYLLGMGDINSPLPEMYSFGSEEEARFYLECASLAWIETEGALFWLIDEYYLYAKKNDIELLFTKKELKVLIKQAFEEMKNI